jgi:hypothetical protein
LPWLAAGLWTLIVIGSCSRVLFFPHASPGTYPIFAQAGRCWLNGENPYPAQDQCNVYRYSPTFTSLFSFLSLCPDPIGNALWRMLNAIVYLAGLVGWVRVLGAESKPLSKGESALSTQHAALFFLLVIPLSMSSTVNAQSNALLIGLLLLAMSAAAKAHWNCAAGCITGATLLKVYPLAAALLLLVLYPRRFALRFAVALVAGLGLPLLLQQPGYVFDQYKTWFHLLGGDNDRTTWALLDRYRDLQLLATVWLRPIPPALYHGLQIATGAAIAGLCWLLQRRGVRGNRLLAFVLGFLTVWMTVFGPATEANTYILVAPTLVWCLWEAWAAAHSWIYRVPITASFLIFTLAQAAIWFPHARLLHSYGPHPFAGLLLFGGLIGAAVGELKAAAVEDINFAERRSAA